ncbi:MAG: formate/nitrite transporter family protein [Kiritimatiellae bacterium]|nr:formate/nitrite transporter family protein [Kiritimatiellia bacterium]
MTPPETVYVQQIDGAPRKTGLPLARLLVLGAMAGAFIALGAATSSTAAHSVANPGLARLVTACVFPVGLLLIVFVGGELFTGNNLLAMAVRERKVGLLPVLRNLSLAWFANFAGAAFVAWLAVHAGSMQAGGCALGAYTVKVAAAKAALSPSQAFCSGVLCNVLVCSALLAGGASKHVSGKFLAVYLPIFAFVAGGFEHSVANMFYLVAGRLASLDPDILAAARSAFGVSGPVAAAGIARNLAWVTLGNLAGGVLFVALPVSFVRRAPAPRKKGVPQK